MSRKLRYFQRAIPAALNTAFKPAADMTMVASLAPSPELKPTMFAMVTHALSTLQFRATALFVVVTLSVTAAVCGYLLQTSARLARSQNEAQLANAASLLADASAALIDANNIDGLRLLAAKQSNGMPLLYVIISDEAGEQLAFAEHRGFDILRKLAHSSERVPVPGTAIAHGPSAAPVFLDITFPITRRANDRASSQSPPATLLGYVRTGMAANPWHRGMAEQIDRVIGVGVLALVVAAPLGFLVIRRIISPLDGLADAMLHFSRGKLNVRSDLARRDEIGRLAAAFNQMADQHQQTHERMRRLNAELEERVVQRTQQLRELASREPLTGLYNRRFFNETLARRFAEAVRYEDDLSCVMIDLDEFKAANDTFGHHLGDELLLLTARTLLAQLRSADVAARFGGDEFIVLLPQTDAAQARILAERIAERFAREVNDRYPRVHVSMSMGIASLRVTHADSAELLVKAADRALYKAKAAGKNQLCTA